MDIWAPRLPSLLREGGSQGTQVAMLPFVYVLTAHSMESTSLLNSQQLLQHEDRKLSLMKTTVAEVGTWHSHFISFWEITSINGQYKNSHSSEMN